VREGKHRAPQRGCIDSYSLFVISNTTCDLMQPLAGARSTFAVKHQSYGRQSVERDVRLWPGSHDTLQRFCRPQCAGAHHGALIVQTWLCYHERLSTQSWRSGPSRLGWGVLPLECKQTRPISAIPKTRCRSRVEHMDPPMGIGILVPKAKSWKRQVTNR